MIKPPFELRVEYLKNPIQIDTLIPRFSWIIEHKQRNQSQSAYRIIVSTEESIILSEHGNYWDSGKVKSIQTNNVPYDGKPLKSDSKYYWRVKWWDKNDSESDFSEIFWFETALLNASDWKAKWISKRECVDKKKRETHQYKSENIPFKELPAFYLRKEFILEKEVKKAKLYICGLGYYEAHLNGKKIGKRILEPAQTDYESIALYSTYDVTKSLQSQNALGVILGNGRCVERQNDQAVQAFKLPTKNYEYPKLIAQINLKYSDGTERIIGTDESWKESMGPIQENGIYFGEKYDARLEMSGWDTPKFNDAAWNKAVLVSGYPLASQTMQPIEITKILKPRKMFCPQPGTYIFDFGQNFTGFVRLYVRGPKGAQIRLRFAEILKEDGRLNTAPNRNALATDIYILSGEGLETFEPHFTYHGFRYVELTGYPGVPSLEVIDGLFFHTNVPKTSEFNCSNQLINQIHTNIIWSQLSNLMSIPTDCPQRDERQGWMGDAQLVTEEAMLNFDMAQFYSKYLRDIKFSQIENGSIPDIVPPYWGIYPADPAWGSAFITIAWYMYWYYNDMRILEENYDAIKNYIDFLIKTSEEDISTHGRYGDWCPPMNVASKRTPLNLVSTWYYYHDTHLLSKIAKILGKEKDFTLYSNKADEIKTAFNSKFLLSEKLLEKFEVNEYKHIQVSPLTDRAISQTSNALPLYLKMVPEDKEKAIINTLIEGIKNSFACHIDTGIIGTRYIFEVLTTYGYPEIAYKMLTQTSYPGYGYMIKEGATTLWERWEKLDSSGMNSYNHIMFGSVDTWFYNTLVGIKCLKSGWNSFQIKPFIPDEMNYACASLKTIRGLIYCAWEKTNYKFKLTVSIPVGCKVKMWIPLINDADIIKEGDNILLEKKNPVNNNIEIKFKRLEEKYALFSMGSGYYQFIACNSEIGDNKS